jgi:hypothetical protein
MIYTIINHNTKQIEGAYMNSLYANMMINNLRKYYKGKYNFYIQEIQTPRNRPTTPQLKQIKEIEFMKKVQFTGITHEAAEKFIQEYS